MFSPRDLATWTRFGVTFQGNAMDFFQQTQTRPIQFNGSYLHIQCLVSKKILDHESFFLMPPQKSFKSGRNYFPLHDLDRVGTTAGWSPSPASSVSDPMNDSWGNWLMKLWMRWGPKHTETPSLRFFLEDEGVVGEDFSRCVQYIVSVHINMADGFVRSFTISNDILGRSQIWDHYRFGQLIPTHPNWTPFCNYKWFVLFWQKALEVSSAFPTIICSRDIIETIGHVFGKKPCKSCNKKHDQISVPVYV